VVNQPHTVTDDSSDCQTDTTEADLRWKQKQCLLSDATHYVADSGIAWPTKLNFMQGLRESDSGSLKTLMLDTQIISKVHIFEICAPRHSVFPNKGQQGLPRADEVLTRNWRNFFNRHLTDHEQARKPRNRAEDLCGAHCATRPQLAFAKRHASRRDEAEGNTPKGTDKNGKNLCRRP
jgi:hypothetical protein